MSLGIAEITFLAQGKTDLVDKLPSGYLTATVGLTIKKLVGDKEVTETIDAILNVAENRATLTIKEPTNLEKVADAITAGNLISIAISEVDRATSPAESDKEIESDEKSESSSTVKTNENEK